MRFNGPKTNNAFHENFNPNDLSVEKLKEFITTRINLESNNILYPLRFTFYIHVENKETILNKYFYKTINGGYNIKEKFSLDELHDLGNYPTVDEKGTIDINIFDLDFNTTLIITLEYTNGRKWLIYYSRLNNDKNTFMQTTACIKKGIERYIKYD